MSDQRQSEDDVSKRDIPSFIEPRPPLIDNPFKRPRPHKGTNLLELFEEDSEMEEPELVQVYLRIKPGKFPNTSYEVRSETCLVTSLETTVAHDRRMQRNVSKMYTFSKIFGPKCNQREIFDLVVKDNLRKLPEGQNFTLLTYGASGSGKTYTLMGTVGAPGLVPRSLEYVFKLVDAAQQPLYKPTENGAEKLSLQLQNYELQWVKRLQQVSAPLRDKYRRMSVQLHSDLTASSTDLSNRTKYYVWVSFIEIYNEAIYDLLAPPEKRMKLRLREDSSGNVYVKGASQAFVSSGEEAYDVMVAGKHNLFVAATGVHTQSSRSHCIFTITMLTETGEGGGGGVRAACVRLCDLAGCERARLTRNTGARMQESRAINSSLHVLERCLHVLRRRRRAPAPTDAHVPYRESKLTRLLGGAFSGTRGEALSMVVTINTAPEFASESKHVLGLATVAQDIQISNTMLESRLESTSSTQETTSNDYSTDIMMLRAENERLHFELYLSQTKYKELLATKAEMRETNAKEMSEVIQEAKNLTREYYETQLKDMQSKMDDMIEEYESRLSAVQKETQQIDRKELLSRIATLEEQLTTERLARAKFEKEVQYLRTHIKGTDEAEESLKDTTPPEEVVVLSDSEHESDEETSDPFNESLEPIFKKDIRRSINQNDTISTRSIDKIVEEDSVSDHENTSINSKDSNNSMSKNASGYDDNVENSANVINENIETCSMNTYNDNINIKNITAENCDNIEGNQSLNETCGSNCNQSNLIKNVNFLSRETYFVSSDDISLINNNDKDLRERTRDTYFTSGPHLDVSQNIDNNDIREARVVSKESVIIKSRFIDDDIINEPVEKNASSLRSTYFVSNLSNVSASIENDRRNPMDVSNLDPNIIKTNTVSGSNLDSNVNKQPVGKSISSLRGTHFINASPSDISQNIESNTEPNTTQDLNERTTLKSSNNISETLVSKILNSRKLSQDSDSSLRQFERLEKATKYLNNEGVHNQSLISDMNTMNEKRIFFAIKPDNAEPIQNKEKRVYFDNINPNMERSEKKINKVTNEEDSHKIVNEGTESDDLNKIKILLDESFTKPEIITSVKKNRLAKQQESVDLFDSPIVFTAKYHDNAAILKNPSDTLIVHKLSLKQNIDDIVTKSSLLNDFVHSTVKNVIESPQTNNITDMPRKEVALEEKIDLKNNLTEKEILKTSLEMEVREGFLNIDEFVEKSDIPTCTSQKLNDSNLPTEKYVINNDTNDLSNKKTGDTQIQPLEQPLETEITIKNEIKLESTYSEEPNQTVESQGTASNNTVDEFEKIYKDISVPRATEFELLVSQSINNTSARDKAETKYNLRNKQSKTNDLKIDKSKIESDEILVHSEVQTEQKPRKRTLRLRRQNVNDEKVVRKLKDIGNLQTEFSDVTLDIPAPLKLLKDIPTPEKGVEENVHPEFGIQSCPAKSITRSRRKLFTPRAEPLEESLSQSGDSNERVCVPRPSYHRPRARRKL